MSSVHSPTISNYLPWPLACHVTNLFFHLLYHCHSSIQYPIIYHVTSSTITSFPMSTHLACHIVLPGPHHAVWCSLTNPVPMLPVQDDRCLYPSTHLKLILQVTGVLSLISSYFRPVEKNELDSLGVTKIIALLQIQVLLRTCSGTVWREFSFPFFFHRTTLHILGPDEPPKIFSNFVLNSPSYLNFNFDLPLYNIAGSHEQIFR
jgi:hypothetical protein